MVASWFHSNGRGVWNPRFFTLLSDWEIEIVERFLARPQDKVVVEGGEDKVCWRQRVELSLLSPFTVA